MVGRDAAVERCVNLLRRGVVSGGDIDELVQLITSATRAVGLSIGSGFGFIPESRVVEVPPDWMDDHRRHMNLDPTPAFLDRNGPFAIYHVERHTLPEEEKKPLLRSFRTHFIDGAIMRPRDGERPLYMALYRPHKARAFDRTDLAVMSALLPWLSLAFATSTAQEAFVAAPGESRDEALGRLGAFALLAPRGDAARFSRAAERLLASRFGTFGPRGRQRVARAIRLGFLRSVHGVGTPRFFLRADLAVELALLPRKDAEADVLARFVPVSPAPPPLLPHELLLSPRQQTVARRAALGESLPQIAEALGISTDVAKAHLEEAYERLGVRSRSELAALYAG